MSKKYGYSGNSLLLSVVNVLTKLSAIISTMILSHQLSLTLYGTYSQTNLIVTTATSLCALGLVDSMNYFFNRSSDPELQKKYINTVMGLQVIAGGIAALVILIFSGTISNYFNNPMLAGLLYLLAFRPVLVNLSVGMQYLHISIGNAKSAAIRNGTMALLRILVVSIVAFVKQDILIILVAYLLFEIFFTVSFYLVFGKQQFWIVPHKIDTKLIKEILGYCLPMGIYIMTNSLNRDIDKLLIGRWCTTEEYAVYANCATILPFGIIASSFMMILVPVMTRYFGKNDYTGAQSLFRNYLKIGYYSSVTFTIPVMLMARESIQVLYGEAYLTGQVIFIIYIMVSTIQFANMSLVLSACGRTKTLMLCSLLSLPLNFVLNILGFKLLGMVGPALATLLVTALTLTALMHFSASSLKCRFTDLFDGKDLGKLLIKMLITAAFSLLLLQALRKMNLPAVFILIVVEIAFAGVILVTSRKNIKDALKQIDRN